MNQIREVKNWAAWINAQPPADPVIHVVGQITAGDESFYKLEKMIPQGINPKILLLQLKIYRSPSIAQPQTVQYSEVLGDIGQYTEVQILDDFGNQVAHITDIPVIY